MNSLCISDNDTNDDACDSARSFQNLLSKVEYHSALAEHLFKEAMCCARERHPDAADTVLYDDAYAALMSASLKAYAGMFH